MLCYVMLCYDMLYHIISYHIISYRSADGRSAWLTFETILPGGFREPAVLGGHEAGRRKWAS